MRTPLYTVEHFFYCVCVCVISSTPKCLVCLGQLLDILDKHIVLDQVLPILHQIPSREPGVLMAILGMFTFPSCGVELKSFDVGVEW